MNLVQTLEQQLEAFKREYEKFERGNKSAGTRARKALQDIKRPVKICVCVYTRL